MGATRREPEAVGGARRYRRARLRWQQAQGWTIGLARSFGYAFSGITQMVRRQRNAQIHFAITAAACGAGWAWGFSRVEWLVLLVTIGLVIGMEAMNTAIEAVVDLASPQFHPLAKQAKDVAAGGVLLVAICAVGIGILLFGQRLLDLVGWLAG